MANMRQACIVLGTYIFLVFVVKIGSSLLCWECNSAYDRRCEDPFEEDTFDKCDCTQRFPNVTGAEYVCRKIVQKVHGKYRYIRSCGYLGAYDKSRPCYLRAGTFDIMIQYCHCTHDACNSANYVSGSTIMTLASIAIGLYTASNWQIA